MPELNKDIADSLKRFNDRMKTKNFGQDRGAIVKEVSQEVASMFAPVLEAMAKNSKITKEDIKEALKEIQIMAPEVVMPEFPEFNIPAPVVHVKPPEVNVNIPEQQRFQLPEIIRVLGEMTMPSVDRKNPLPVLMMDIDGKPFQFSQGATGGRGDFFTIKDILNSSGGSLFDNDGAMRVSGSFSVTASNSSTQAIDSSGNPYSQANPMPVTVVSGSAATTGSALVDSSGVQYSGSNPLPVGNNVVDTFPATQNITTVDVGSTTTPSANGQNIITGSPTANSAASFALSGIETVRIQVTGTWTGTLAVEQSIDGGTTWVGLGLHQGGYTVGSFTANFVGGGNVGGATNLRVRATAAITGTAVVKVTQSFNPQSVYLANAAPAGNVISLLNSSTATLGSGATYTGTGEDVSNFSEMRITVFSNVASATDGLSVQQSTDNTNWDVTDTYTIPAGTAKTYVVPRQARYFRIVYTNGGTIQTSFRLQAILNRTATSSSSQRASDAYTNETDLEQVWAFLSAFNGTTWDRIRMGAGTGDGAMRTVAASDVASSVNVVNTNSLDIKQVSGSIDSVFVSGAADSFFAYEVMTTNKTAKADGSDIRAKTDKIGRQVFRPHQVRDLMATAYVSIANGTETTLRAAVAGAYLDLVYILGTNNSDAAVQVDFRAVTGGNIVTSLVIPPYGTVGLASPSPIPQADTGNNWTADLPDITGTTVTLSALFAQEV